MPPKKILTIGFTRRRFDGYRHRFESAYKGPDGCRLKLCEAELRAYVDLPTESDFEVVLTTKKPKGQNFHVLKWSKTIREHYLALVPQTTRPSFYGEINAMLKREFGYRTVYAWVMA